MSESIPDRDLDALAASLAALAPAPSALDRDQLMFRAGQLAARPRTWLWPAVASVLALTVAVLGGALWLRPTPAPQIVYVVVPEPVPPESPIDDPPSFPDEPLVRPSEPGGSRLVQGGSWSLWRRMVRDGLDAPLPLPAAVGGPPVRESGNNTLLHLQRTLLKTGGSL